MLPGGGGGQDTQPWGTAVVAPHAPRVKDPSAKEPYLSGRGRNQPGKEPWLHGSPPPPPPRGGDSAQAAPGGGSASLTASEGAISLMLLRKERYDVP